MSVRHITNRNKETCTYFGILCLFAHLALKRIRDVARLKDIFIKLDFDVRCKYRNRDEEYLLIIPTSLIVLIRAQSNLDIK